MPPRKLRNPQTASTSKFRSVPLDAIDEPPLPIRQSMDPVKLEALALSISQVGVVQSLVLESRGDRFIIHAGHRRFIAARRTKLTEVPAIVYPPGMVTGEEIKIHENIFREDLNTCDEALFFNQLLETRCGGDVDQLCQLTQLRREYVETRLLLLRGDEEVWNHLAKDEITFAVAKELNKVKDGATRKMFLIAAKNGGATGSLVQSWRMQSEMVLDAALNGPAEITPLPGNPPADIGSTLCCFLCEKDDRKYELKLLYAHESCYRVILERFLEQLLGHAQKEV